MGLTRFSGGILQLVFLVAVLASELGGNYVNASHLDAGGRTLLQVQQKNGSSQLSRRTERIDPLDGFKRYRGGFNITDKHYWSSVIFTGVHGYGIGLLWLLSGALYAAVLLIFAPASRTTGGRERKRKRNSGAAGRYLWSLPAGALFTSLAIVASAVALAGSTSFHSRAGEVKIIIEAAARRASGTIYNVTSAVRSMQNDAEISGGLGVSSLLASTSRKLNDEASRIQKRAEKNARMIGRGLKILEAITVVVISLNMAAVLLLLGSGFLKLKCPFHTLLILSWVLTSLCWACFGLYFFLDRFAGDTCAALGEYQQDPRNSSLSTILPCNDKLSTKLVLRDTRAGIYHLIKKVNANMSNLTSSSFPVAVYICNPFSPPPDYKYQPESCSAGEIRIGDIPTILKRYTCSEGDGSTCGAGEFIPAGDYNKVLVYTTSVQNLMNSFPGVESLVSCKLVKDAFSDILTRYCRPLKRYAHMAWAAMAALSTVTVLLLLTWLMAARGNSRHPSSNVNPQLCKDTTSPSTEVNKIEDKNIGGSV